MSMVVPLQTCRALLVCCCVAAVSALGAGHSTSNASSIVTPIEKVTTILQDMKTKNVQLKLEADTHIADVRNSCTETQTKSTSAITHFGVQIDSLVAYIASTEVAVKGLTDSITERQLQIAADEEQLATIRTASKLAHATYQKEMGEYDVTIAAIKRAQEVMKVQATGEVSGGSFLQTRQSRIRKHSSSRHEAVQALQTAMIAVTARIQADNQTNQTQFSKDADHIFGAFESLTTATQAYEAKQAGSVQGILENLLTSVSAKKTEIMNTEKSRKDSFVAEETALMSDLTSGKADLVNEKETRAEKELDLLRKKGELTQYTETKAATEKYLAEVQVKCQKQESDYTEMNELRTQEAAALDKAIAFITSISSSSLLQIDTDAGQDRDHLVFPMSGLKSSTGSPTQNMAGFIRVRAAQLSSISLRTLASKVSALGSRAKADPLAKVKTMIQDLIVKLQQDSLTDKAKNEWCETQLKHNHEAQTSAKEGIEKTTARIKKTQADLEAVVQEIATLKTSYNETLEQRAELVKQRAEEKAANEKAISDANESAVALDAAMTILEEYYKNVSKAYGVAVSGGSAFYQRSKEEPASSSINISVPTEMPSELVKEAPSQVSLEAGNNVIALLEVVRDKYNGIATRMRKQEADAEQLYIDTLGEADIKIAAMEKEQENKQVLNTTYSNAVPAHQEDLRQYTQSLSDETTNYENLQGPCLGGDDAAQRKAQLEGEIAALKEAEQMIEDFYPSAFLQKRASLISASGTQDAVIVGDIAEVITLLNQIKTEVMADILSDQETYTEMHEWCTTNINNVANAITAHNSRDTDLVNTIEVSTSQQARLEIELKNLQSEKSQAQQAKEQHAALRANDLEAFRQNEKELLQSIKSLDSAIVVLSGHYDKVKAEDERNFTLEREQVEAANASINEKLAANISLVNVVGQVARALKSMPASEMNNAVGSSDSNAILQAFLADPLELLGRKRATLTQTSARLSGTVDGNTVMGILKELLETFTADLKAAQQREGADATSFTSQQDAKQVEINTLTMSVDTKEQQLAHYVTVRAQAKEDLAYLREIRSSDVTYLTQIKTQCATNDAEYASRSATRQSELQAINDGIAMLEASSPVSGGGAAAAAAAASSFLLHPQPQPSEPQHSLKHKPLVFVHHRQPVNRMLLKVARGRVSTTEVGNRSRASLDKGSHRMNVTIARVNASLAGKSAKSLLQSSLLTSPLPSQIHGGSDRKALRVLQEKVTLVLKQKSQGVADDAFREVIRQLDIVHQQLKKDKQLEVEMRDTCIKEKASSDSEHEQRKAEQTRLESAATRLDASINETTQSIADVDEQIKQMNESLVTALEARNKEHAVFKTSVAKELQMQAKLQKAIQVLRDFYASKGIVKLLQRPTNSSQNFSRNAQLGSSEHKALIPEKVLPAVPVHLASASSPPKVLPAVPMRRATTNIPAKVLPAAPVHLASAGISRTFAANSSDPVNAPLANVTNYTKMDKSSVKAAERLEIPNITKFEKPLRPHSGSKGVIGILELLISDSQQLVEKIVQSEEYGLDAYSLDVQKTQQSIEDSKQQRVTLNAVLANAENDLRDNTAAQIATMNEIEAIVAYIQAINTKCNTLLANFDANQATRQTEIDDIWEARSALVAEIQSDA